MLEMDAAQWSAKPYLAEEILNRYLAFKDDDRLAADKHMVIHQFYVHESRPLR